MATFVDLTGAVGEAVVAAQGGSAGAAGQQVAPGAAAAAKPKPPVDEEAATHIDEQVAEVFAGYRPCISLGKPHPSPIVESGLLSSIPLPSLTYPTDGIPSSTVDGGKLSALQLEAVMYAGQRHMLMQSGTRAGFFLGDGTGVGKGRQLAGIMLDNIARGRKKHVWITTSGDLKQEAINDFADIGAGGVLVKDLNELDKAHGALGLSTDFKDPAGGMVLFVTFSGLTSSKRASKVDKSRKVSRIDQICAWLGDEAAFEGVICFDEAHKAKNFKSDKPEQSSHMSRSVIELQQRLPRARVVYASATGLESLEHMAYAERMMLWGNPSFPSFEAFQSKFIKRGIGSLELLAAQMKQSGSYVSRSLSWDGAEFDLVELAVDPAQAEAYRRSSDFFFKLKRELELAVAATNSPGGAQSPIRMLWGLAQRFFRDLINSMKVEHIAQEAERAVQEGFCVVVGLQSTGESGMNKLLEEKGETGYSGAKYMSELASATQSALVAFLRDHFPVARIFKEAKIRSVEEILALSQVYAQTGVPYDLEGALRRREEEIRASQNVSKEPQTLPELVAVRDQLIAEAQALDLPPSPLDALIDRLGGVSKVAEMTGRRGRLVRSKEGDRFVYELREHGQIKGAAAASDAVESVNIQERKQFMDGKKLIAIISDAASTGISLHASLSQAKNQRRRIHMTLELSFSADKTLQQLGRTHRANQSSAPIYKLITTTFGGERRFAAGVAKRLLSLGALTRGDRRAATVMDFSSFALDNKEGGTALRRVLEYLDNPTEVSEDKLLNYVNSAEAIHIPDIDMTDAMSILTRAKAGVEKLGLNEGSQPATVKRFLNRIMVLPEGDQNLLFHLFTAELDAVVADAKKAGTHDTGVVDLRGSSLKLAGPLELVWKDELTGAKCEAATVAVDRGVAFDEALKLYHEALEEDPECGVAFWESKKETYGRHFYQLVIPKLTAPDLVFVVKPHLGRDPCEKDLDRVKDTYRRLSDPEDARRGWTSTYELTESHCIHGHNCKHGSGCTDGSRRQTTRLIVGAVVQIWTALESTIIKFRADLTVKESGLGVVRVALDDGRRLVGVRFPVRDDVLTHLITTTKEIVSKHESQGGSKAFIDPPAPIAKSVLQRATTAKRTLESFFKPAAKKPKA